MSYLSELLAGYRQGVADGCQVPITTARDALGRAVDPHQRGQLLAVVAIALADDDAREVPAEYPVSLTKGAKGASAATVQPWDDRRQIAACA